MPQRKNSEMVAGGNGNRGGHDNRLCTLSPVAADSVIFSLVMLTLGAHSYSDYQTVEQTAIFLLVLLYAETTAHRQSAVLFSFFSISFPSASFISSACTYRLMARCRFRYLPRLPIHFSFLIKDFLFVRVRTLTVSQAAWAVAVYSNYQLKRRQLTSGTGHDGDRGTATMAVAATGSEEVVPM